ncbi:MAG TPA: nuclear transport factor 2 family protein, partial [Candidatus Sulfotelmatobacter sp.]|nr:nuclear transport factor 2 family protein [Candidatus Sulfotelmatobacter sp.]
FFRRVYGDDFVGILPSGQILDKMKWIAAVENSGVQYSSFIASDIRVRMFQETAVVTCLWSSHGTKNGKAFSRQSRITHVYVYGQRGWQLVSSQETLLPG